MKFLAITVLLLIAGLFIFQHSPYAKGLPVAQTIQGDKPEGLPFITVGGGCFWCIESEFRTMEGVHFTRVGYTGGTLDNPTYQDITTGTTGHAEAIQVYYDPDTLSERDLLDYFLLKAHDPTQLNRQGVDRGTQYRSVIFTRNEAEKQRAIDAIEAANTSGAWDDKIVTTLEPLSTFWDAEEYHQQYYEKYEKETGKPHIRVLIKKQKKAIQ